MEEYLKHWWRGDLALHYELFGLCIPQINRLAKLGQYVAGLLTVFELVTFARVATGARVVTFVALKSWQFWRLLFNIPRLLARLVAAIVLAALGHVRWREVFKGAVVAHAADAAADAGAIARSSFTYRGFMWLEKHPVPQAIIRGASFSMFAIFSAVELFTS